jgi:hypothetical protein
VIYFLIQISNYTLDSLLQFAGGQEEQDVGGKRGMKIALADRFEVSKLINIPIQIAD